jgi:hypothetical protein
VTKPAKGPTAASRARAITRLLIVVVAVAAYLGVVFLVSAINSPASKITGLDMLALPEEEVELGALIETDGPTLFHPNFAGLQVDFYLRGKIDRLPTNVNAPSSEGAKIGSTTADPDGYIALKFSAPIEPGSYQIDLRLAHPGEIELESANRYLLLTVIPADRPIIVTDIDDTLCQSKLLNNNNDAPPFDDAPDTLNEAASQCQVIYLTPRTVHRARETRHWLGAYGFPPGPVFFRDLWSDPEQVGFPESYFKAMFLVRQVRPKWSNIAWGVGHVEGDGEAYSANDEDTESTSEATPPGESR